jgi:TPR repeat protein
MHWWLKAAERGNIAAQLSVGQSFARGEGVPKDAKEACKWLLRVVDAEEKKLGAMAGRPGKRVTLAEARAQSGDPAILAKWDAQQRFALAQSTLGLIYAEGSGVPQDMAEAVAWWTKAAERECAAAQFNLGLCYYRGLGEPKDYVEASKWMTLAAGQGYGDAAKVQNDLEQQMSIDQIAAAQRLTREFEPYQQP